MQKKFEALESNETWESTELPKDQKAIGYKQFYKIKYRLDGTIERYKVRLVTKGFTQIE